MFQWLHFITIKFKVHDRIDNNYINSENSVKKKKCKSIQVCTSTLTMMAWSGQNVSPF